MLEKLLEHDGLGSAYQINKILELLETNSYSKEDLKYACSKIDYSFNRSFDGVISLLSWLKIINLSELISINKKIKRNETETSIALLILKKLASSNELHNLINSNNLIFDESYIVKNSLIPLEFSPLRNILINLGFFQKDTLVVNHFNINPLLTDWFASIGIELIEASKKKNFSLRSLNNLQERQSKQGLDAEKFVLRYELNSRKKHPSKDRIEIISEDHVSAGFDIISYVSDESIVLDKYIEVKSYSQVINSSEKPYFYWSTNEVKTSKREKNNYFLYLVNRDEMKNNEYCPIMIQNPYKNVFNNENWSQIPQSWKFELNGNF